MNKSVIFLFFRICLFITIGQHVLYLDKIEILNSFFSIARTILFPFTLGMIAYLRTKLENYKLYSYIGLFFLIELVSSIINNVPNILPIISFAMSIVLLFSTIAIGCMYDITKTIKILRDTLFVYTILNFILVLIYPDGVWMDIINKWTLEERGRYLIGGNRNQMGAFLLCAQISAFLYYLQSSKGKSLYLIIAVCSIITLVIVDSKTSLIGNTFFILFLTIREVRNKKRVIKIFILTYIVFQLFAVFLISDLSKIGIVSYVIENILNKDLTFSNRTTIWIMTTNVISDSPWIGWGLHDNEWNNTYIGGVSTHNFVYSILLKGGILQLLSFILIMIYIVKSVNRYLSKQSLTTYFGLWVLLFMMIMEVYNIYIICIFLSMVLLSTQLSKYDYNNYTPS